MSVTRRDALIGAGAVAAGAVAAGRAAAQDAAAGGGGADPFRDWLGNGMTNPPGDDIPVRLIGRPMPAQTDLPMPPERRLGWAVAGLGDFAVNHQIPALGRARLSRLAGLVSGNAEKAARIAESYGIEGRHVYDYDGFDSIAADEAIDVVYVITPNALHEDLVIRALEAGKHVMVEKPMATTAAACERMIAAAEAAGRKLMVAYRAHFEPHNLRAKEMMDAGELGAVNFIDAYTHRPLDVSRPRDQWRVRRDLAGGGSLPDIGIYALNGAIFYLGEAPVALAAQVQSPPGDPRFAEVEDVCAVQARFASGALANFSSSYTTAANRISIFGDGALATLSPATAYHGNNLTVSEGGTTRQIATDAQSDVQFHREMDHLSEAIMTGGEVRTPGAMGLRDLRLIEAIYEAARRREWVELDAEGRIRG